MPIPGRFPLLGLFFRAKPPVEKKIDQKTEPLIKKTQVAAKGQITTLAVDQKTPRPSLASRAWTWIKSTKLAKGLAAIAQFFASLFTKKRPIEGAPPKEQVAPAPAPGPAPIPPERITEPVATTSIINQNPPPGQGSEPQQIQEQHPSEQSPLITNTSLPPPAPTAPTTAPITTATSTLPTNILTNEIPPEILAEGIAAELELISTTNSQYLNSLRLNETYHLNEFASAYYNTLSYIDWAEAAVQQFTTSDPKMTEIIQQVKQVLELQKTEVENLIGVETSNLLTKLLDDANKKIEEYRTHKDSDSDPKKAKNAKEDIANALYLFKFFEQFPAVKALSRDFFDHLGQSFKDIDNTEIQVSIARTPPPIPAPRGLNNIGNSCYMNGALQLLIGDNFLENLIENPPKEHDLLREQFTPHLKSVLTALKSKGNLNQSLTALRAAFFNSGVNYDFTLDQLYAQQDSASFLLGVLGILGYNVSYRQQRTVKFEGVEHVRPGAPDPKQLISIQISSAQYPSCQDLLDGEFGLNQINDPNNAIKQEIGGIERGPFAEFKEQAFLEGTPPANLFIQMKRFTYLKNRAIKIDKSIAFNNDFTVDFKQAFKDSAEPKLPYKAIAFVVHEGGSSINGGHYYTYRQDEDGKWRCYNDSSVREVTADFAKQQLEKSGYLIQFKRVES